MPESSRTICIVEDDSSTARALSRLIAENGYETVVFNTGGAFIRSSARENAACLLLDVNLPDLNGLELQDMLIGEDGPPIVFLTGNGDVPMSVRAMRGGAVDFLLKPASEDDLIDAISRARALHSEKTVEKDIRTATQERIATLTDREMEVFRCVLSGATNKQIARYLGIAEKTVKVHRGHLTQKLGVRRVVDLLELAQNAGIEADPDFEYRSGQYP